MPLLDLSDIFMQNICIYRLHSIATDSINCIKTFFFLHFLLNFRKERLRVSVAV